MEYKSFYVNTPMLCIFVSQNNCSNIGINIGFQVTIDSFSPHHKQEILVMLVDSADGNLLIHLKGYTPSLYTFIHANLPN